MKRAVSNAFTRSSRGFRSPSRSLAASLASMQVQLDVHRDVHRVELSPITAFDAIAASTTIGGQEQRPLTILLDVSIRSALDEPGNPEQPANELQATAARWGIGVVPLGDGAVLASDAALRQLLTLVDVEAVTALRVTAPLDPVDARTIADAVASGASPTIDPRVIAAIEVRDDQTAHIAARRFEDAIRLVGENFRHYLAAVCNDPPTSFIPVPADVLGVWLRDGGVMTVRPIETDVYSTFIDVGVCLTEDPNSGPARAALIYDRPSASWHGE